jgi:thiamine biosynthesis lipoprotein
MLQFMRRFVVIGLVVVLSTLAWGTSLSGQRASPSQQASLRACGVTPLEGRIAVPKLAEFRFSQPHMGTLFRIALFAPDEVTAKKGADAAFARIAHLDGIMSDYKPASELMQLCKKAGGGPIDVSKDLFDVLAQAEQIAKETDGLFDVSIAPVVKLWHKARRTRMLPDADELKKAIAKVDFRKIKLDSSKRTVQLLLMGMLLDLGGIAKGYAADAALQVLAGHGLPRALVAAGGDIAVGEPPPGQQGWKVGIAPLKDPDGPPTHWLLLKNAAVSTSGDAEQNAVIDGKRYSHVMDPKTGMGLVGRRSVSIIAPKAVLTDAYSTAVSIMKQEDGLKFLEARPDLAGILVYEIDGKEVTRTTKNFGKHVYTE